MTNLEPEYEVRWKKAEGEGNYGSGFMVNG